MGTETKKKKMCKSPVCIQSWQTNKTKMQTRKVSFNKQFTTRISNSHLSWYTSPANKEKKIKASL